VDEHLVVPLAQTPTHRRRRDELWARAHDADDLHVRSP
jgi:hypothetical protein